MGHITRCSPRHRATHEAGHAVIAHRLELRVLVISLATVAGNPGFTTVDVADREGLRLAENRNLDWRLCTYKMAAGLAEIMRYHRKPIGADDDVQRIQQILAALFPYQDQREIARVRLLRETRKLVHKHWATIVVVAESLLTTHTLDGDRFVEIVDGV